MSFWNFKKNNIQTDDDIDETMYLSVKEERRLAKENKKVFKEYTMNKRRKNVSEEEYLTKMRDIKNVVEIGRAHV